MLIGDMSGSCAVLLNASVLHVLFSAAKIRQIICISKFFTEKLTPLPLFSHFCPDFPLESGQKRILFLACKCNSDTCTFWDAVLLSARRLIEVKPTLLVLLFVLSDDDIDFRGKEGLLNYRNIVIITGSRSVCSSLCRSLV